MVAESGSVLGYARGGPSCHQSVGFDAAMGNVESTVCHALAAAGLADRSQWLPVRLGVYCLAGLDLPIDAERLHTGISARKMSERDILHNDTMAVFRAGAHQHWGVGLVCGAGINCAALSPDDRAVRFPALGELSGDFTAGGSWLGTRALGLALRASDGRGPESILRTTVPQHFATDTPEAVLESLYTGAVPFGRLVTLAPLVFQAAGAGDVAARQTVDMLADELVAFATAAIRRLDMNDLPVQVVLGGGIFKTEDAAFHERVRNGVRSVAPRATFALLDAPPVLGAALLGADALDMDAPARQRLHQSLVRAMGIARN